MMTRKYRLCLLLLLGILSLLVQSVTNIPTTTPQHDSSLESSVTSSVANNSINDSPSPRVKPDGNQEESERIQGKPEENVIDTGEKAKKSKRKHRPRKKNKLNSRKKQMQLGRSMNVEMAEDYAYDAELDIAKELLKTFKGVDVGGESQGASQLLWSLLGESYNFAARYLNDTAEINDPILKHYKLYEDSYYPAWTYFGFSASHDWHNIPIKYFITSSASQTSDVDVKSHRSFMNLCSHEVTHNVSICRETMENECLSVMPSPIDIITKDAVEDEGLDHFEYVHYDTFFGFTMFIPEDGSDLLFLTFLPPKRYTDRKPSISEGSVTNHELFLDRILFHFGKSPSEGSEHTINGKSFGMEIQLYFTGDRLPYWESLAKYRFMKRTDPYFGKNVHIMSVMVSVGQLGAKLPPDKDEKFSSAFEIISNVASMFWEGSNSNKFRAVRVDQKILSLKDFLGAPSTGLYYTYEGSLSHPPCLTHAKWTIFEKPIWITFDQWVRFTRVKSEFSDHANMADNRRPMRNIKFKADLPTYTKIRSIEGLPSLSQRELEFDVEYNPTSGTDSKEAPLYFIRKYTSYPHYFAKRVRKSKPAKGRQSSEDDYYDTTEVTSSSPKPITQYMSHTTPNILVVCCLFLVNLI